MGSLLNLISPALTVSTQAAVAQREGRRAGQKEAETKTLQAIAALRQKHQDELAEQMQQAQIGNLNAQAQERLRPPPPRNIDPLSVEGQTAQINVAKGRPVAPNNYDEVARHNKAMEALAGQRAAQGGAQGQRIQAVYKKQAQTLDNLKDAIATYRAQLKKTGIEVMPGQNKSVLTGSYANLKLLAKEAANLGALTGPDVKILEELFNDPATLGSAALNVMQGGQRAKGLLAQLDQYESIVNGNRARLEQNYGGDVGATAATQDQQDWDDAVKLYGRERVLKEYGPRPEGD